VHLVDATMFWSPTGGGVRRYLQTKHAWLEGQPEWRHTIAVPLAGSGPAGAGVARLPSVPLPASGGYRLPLDRAAIARVLVALQPDLIEAGDPYRVAWGALDAAERLSIPAVAYCHSNIVAMARLAGGRRFGPIAAGAARRYARRLYRRFDLVLAPSQALLAHLDDWGIDGAGVAPLGVDTALFHPGRDRRGWRDAHGIGDDVRLLIYVGRFAAEKHLDVLAAAVARLGAPYRLVAIGAGPAPPPPGERVTVLPFVADAGELADALAAADRFVHAGDQETFGLSLLEALACGTPAVVRAAEGLAEWVDGHACLGVGPADAGAFAEAIAASFDGAHDGDRDDDHDDEPEGRRLAARRRAEAHDWGQALTRLTDRYRTLVTGEPPRPAVASPVLEGGR